MELMAPHQALAEAVTRCALHGTSWQIVNSGKETVWDIEADTKADDEDLSYPVIVHMRGGTLALESIAILLEAVA